jgi:hypothetical protein
VVVFRLVFILLLLASVFCFGASIVTGNRAWRKRGVVLMFVALGGALAFFAVLLVVSMVQR